MGLVNFFVPMCNGRGKQIIFGMAEELLRRSIAYGYNSLPKEFENGKIPPEILKQYAEKGKLPPRYMTRFSAEIFALVLTELCQNEGVELLFDTVVTHTVATADDAKILRGLVVEINPALAITAPKCLLTPPATAMLWPKCSCLP